MRVDRLDYDLPAELIAARPPADRDGGRLMVLSRGAEPADRRIVDLPDLIPPSALVVVNDTRVMPARLFGHKPTGGKVELLLLERLETRGEDAEIWRALARASKAMGEGTRVAIDKVEGFRADVVRKDETEPGTIDVLLTAPTGKSVTAAIDEAGHVPLPPYVGREDEPEDRERYQTIFARRAGAVAAPTAGLHLSERLVARLEEKGIAFTSVTLHVSLGTFQPVKVDDLDEHPMHAEWYEIGDAARDAIAAARARNSPVIAIGTTAVRALESAADPERPGHVLTRSDRTRLLIQPGYTFKVVDGLLTNFHLPRSTLLALVSAFAGYEETLAAYRAAVERRYRFFSYGDAMLVLDRHEA
ncbi:MAG: tRNA preQ1(34) S-adenosylmethionine ribosyltransferase-isomerase QueA [Polyangiaceae bacterium]|nr:tRNA preQ1(34) S-adenosylmethionine ribosyltransferase-isomerase QueA [Polyangiaceae bacterium]